jgi:hypothetical protein
MSAMKMEEENTRSVARRGNEYEHREKDERMVVATNC